MIFNPFYSGGEKITTVGLQFLISMIFNLLGDIVEGGEDLASILNKYDI